MKTKVIALVSNNISTDQRLIKVGATLQNNGIDFLLIGTQHRGSPTLNHIPFKTKRTPIFFKKNFPFYAELQFRLFLELLKTPKKNSIILANDLDTLIPAKIISVLFKLPLVVDFHEIYSEMPSLKQGSIQKRVWKFFERIFVPGLQNTYTVSESYAQWFKKEYKIQPKVIKNVPFKIESPILEKNSDKNIILYQGAINPSRGIDKMILAMQYLENSVLWIIGDGPLFAEYKLFAKENGVAEKISFFGKISPDELRLITPQADIGLSLEEDNGLSYRYALPNKVFDYIHAGIPVLGSCDLPEMKKLIHEFKIGMIIENHDPEHIAEKMKALLKLGKPHFQPALKQATEVLNWENQEKSLLEIFNYSQKATEILR